MVLRQFRFTYAYSFADRVVMAVRGLTGEPHLADFLDPSSDDFCNRVSRPSKSTLLHAFIANLDASDFEWSAYHFPDVDVELYRTLLESAGVKAPSWLVRGKAVDHRSELAELLRDASAVVTDSTFHLLFGDREFLLEFQQLVAPLVQSLAYEKHRDILVRPGVLRRPTYLSAWLKRAVFLRDKGLCQQCYCDLTGTVNVEGVVHLDHMLPLELSGSNDPTNFQLLCASCNAAKGASVTVEVHRVATYW